MGCCGEKRKRWLEETNTSKTKKTKEIFHLQTETTNKPERIFEYTGSRSLRIKGMYSGKSYFFERKGERIKVELADSFSFMSERDLRLILK